MDAALLFGWLTLCAAQDIHQRRIANLLTLGVAALALAYLLATGSTWWGGRAAQGGWALLLALAFTLPGYAMGRMGAGDVKLMAALGLLTDPLHVLGTFIGAGATSLLWFLLMSRGWAYLGPGLRTQLRHLDPQQSGHYAFAPFALLGMALTVLWIH
ncbi:prepilin peptidase [Pseudomonas chlororaphis]|uniref:Peptidase A24A, prepilin type IV n=1 Tax=Pseudomonas chlororaphis TaxID=587753 RepID=A0A0D5Y7A4_9PSED|nr:prepilin peptidase [Pseudomonas chlororaphis]AKA26847.1 peptidase A24A, prepilin type IV [Pseudomonas chlororaphis]